MTERKTEVFEFPSEIRYRIYNEFFNGRYTNRYRLIEIDEWDEFHQIELVRGRPLDDIFYILGLMDCLDKLDNKEAWEEVLEEKRYELEP